MRLRPWLVLGWVCSPCWAIPKPLEALTMVEGANELTTSNAVPPPFRRKRSPGATTHQPEPMLFGHVAEAVAVRGRPTVPRRAAIPATDEEALARAEHESALAEVRY